jgi:hypothetical protein
VLPQQLGRRNTRRKAHAAGVGLMNRTFRCGLPRFLASAKVPILLISLLLVFPGLAVATPPSAGAAGNPTSCSRQTAFMTACGPSMRTLLRGGLGGEPCHCLNLVNVLVPLAGISLLLPRIFLNVRSIPIQSCRQASAAPLTRVGNAIHLPRSAGVCSPAAYEQVCNGWAPKAVDAVYSGGWGWQEGADQDTRARRRGLQGQTVSHLPSACIPTEATI